MYVEPIRYPTVTTTYDELITTERPNVISATNAAYQICLNALNIVAYKPPQTAEKSGIVNDLSRSYGWR